MSDKNKKGSCGTRTCDWVMNGGNGKCVPGTTGTCLIGLLIEAEESEFHDRKLIQATMNINDILSGLKDSAGDRQLSFLVTEAGIVLGWVKHGAGRGTTAGDVTADSDIGTVATALGLRL